MSQTHENEIIVQIKIFVTIIGLRELECSIRERSVRKKPRENKYAINFSEYI